MNVKGYSGVKPISTIDKSKSNKENKQDKKENFAIMLMKYQKGGKRK